MSDELLSMGVVVRRRSARNRIGSMSDLVRGATREMRTSSNSGVLCEIKDFPKKLRQECELTVDPVSCFHPR